MVMLLEDTAVLFICISMAAKELRGPPAGLRSRSAPDNVFGGREETQSWMQTETWGFDRRLRVFLELGFEVMMMVGPDGRFDELGNGCDGR